MAADVSPLQSVARRGAVVADGLATAARAGSLWGDAALASVVPTRHMLADEGSYYVSNNGPPGPTAASGIGDSNYAAVSAHCAIYNLSVNQRIYLDYYRIVIQTASISGTSLRGAVGIDRVIQRTTSTSVAKWFIYNTGGNDRTCDAVVLGSPQNATVTPSFATQGPAYRVVSNFILCPVNPPASSEYVIAFGDSQPAGSARDTGGRGITQVPPVIIGPGAMALIHLWVPNFGTGASGEYELGFWCR